ALFSRSVDDKSHADRFRCSPDNLAIAVRGATGRQGEKERVGNLCPLDDRELGAGLRDVGHSARKETRSVPWDDAGIVGRAERWRDARRLSSRGADAFLGVSADMFNKVQF